MFIYYVVKNKIKKVAHLLMFILAITDVHAGLSTVNTVTLGGGTHNVIHDDSSGFSWLAFTHFYGLSLSEQLLRLGGSPDWMIASNVELGSLRPYVEGGRDGWHNSFDRFDLGVDSRYLRGRRLVNGSTGGFYSNEVLGFRTFAFTADSSDSDVGLWVVNTSPSVSVPIPPTTTLLFLGSLALFAKIRRRKQTPLISPTPLNTNTASA